MENATLNLEEFRRKGVVALKEKDQFSIWVKTACCNLNSKQLGKLADITDKYGRGLLLFTSRQIPIIPFVNIKDVSSVKQELAEVEMELDRCGARVRNLNVCYEDKICPEATVNCISLGEKLEKFFGSQLMHKIKIGVVGCSKDCIICRVLDDISFIGVEADGVKGYEAYVGGRLGVNATIGIRITGPLSEDQSVKLVQNYFDLLEKQGQPGERAADLIKRLGKDIFKEELIKDIVQVADLRVIDCTTRLNEKSVDKIIVRIRVTCGEATSGQVRKIADLSEQFGKGLVHFSVRGSPEILGVASENIPLIQKELVGVNLELIENGLENIQSCFGNYCVEGLVDPQTLIKKVERKIKDSNIGKMHITVSASGCPNSCGIAHLSDIGFHGVVEPEVDVTNCTGCGLCAAACKRNAIFIQDNKASIDFGLCRYCGQCIAICPLSSISEKKRGFAVLLGGGGGKDTYLGIKIADFVSEEVALEITQRLINMLKGRGTDARAIIERMGLNNVQHIIVPEGVGVGTQSGIYSHINMRDRLGCGG